jgi:23S rRNA (adenine2503-C2)-methyltransferase
MGQSKPQSLLGMNREELTGLVHEAAQPRYRARQIADAVYRQRVESVEQISTLPQAFQSWLAEKDIKVGPAEIDKKFISRDGTVRYLIGFGDDQSVEAVWMPEGDGGEAGDGSEAGDEALATQEAAAENEGISEQQDRVAAPNYRLNQKEVRTVRRSTICISSQVGCAVDCQFCLTALLGVKRNLTAGEIVGQVCAVLKDQNVSPPGDRVNLVFMGMGEPFLNYDNFMKAARLLVQEVGIAERRMTVSTAGIVPRIYDFAEESIRPKLAISLNAPNDELRSRIMPLNKKWNLQKLRTAAKDFPLRTREWITFEYVLLGGVNDTPENAREVAELLRGLRCKVNLIALNPGPGIDFSTPGEDRVARFQNTLREAGIPAYLRRPRGRDIYAACGQLKRTVEVATMPGQSLPTFAPAE